MVADLEFPKAKIAEISISNLSNFKVLKTQTTHFEMCSKYDRLAHHQMDYNFMMVFSKM